MFGRSRTPTAPSVQVETGASQPTAGKGRPTPRRRESEQRNRQPLIGAASRQLPAGASRAERKAARAEQRQAMAAERALSRQALITGDERHLPARDRGPARRWARDYVDARRNVAEYFLPVALVLIVVQMLPIPGAAIASGMLVYAMVIAVAVDLYLLRRRLQRLGRERFGDKAAGLAGYGMMRALQFRRSRLPRPQVARGRYPD